MCEAGLIRRAMVKIHRSEMDLILVLLSFNQASSIFPFMNLILIINYL